MAKKTEPCDVYDKWTTARFFSFIRSSLRRAYSKWPPKYEVLKEARRDYDGHGRQKYEYQCDICENWFPQKEIEIDHIEPCGSLRCWEDLTPFTQRLFCGKNGLRVVCKPCHKIRTKEERDAGKN